MGFLRSRSTAGCNIAASILSTAISCWWRIFTERLNRQGTTTPLGASDAAFLSPAHNASAGKVTGRGEWNTPLGEQRWIHAGACASFCVCRLDNSGDRVTTRAGSSTFSSIPFNTQQRHIPDTALDSAVVRLVQSASLGGLFLVAAKIDARALS